MAAYKHVFKAKTFQGRVQLACEECGGLENAEQHKSCYFCGPVCYAGAEHNQRVENGDRKVITPASPAQISDELFCENCDRPKGAHVTFSDGPSLWCSGLYSDKRKFQARSRLEPVEAPKDFEDEDGNYAGENEYGR